MGKGGGGGGGVGILPGGNNLQSSNFKYNSVVYEMTQCPMVISFLNSGASTSLGNSVVLTFQTAIMKFGHLNFVHRSRGKSEKAEKVGKVRKGRERFRKSDIVHRKTIETCLIIGQRQCPIINSGVSVRLSVRGTVRLCRTWFVSYSGLFHEVRGS